MWEEKRQVIAVLTRDGGRTPVQGKALCSAWILPSLAFSWQSHLHPYFGMDIQILSEVPAFPLQQRLRHGCHLRSLAMHRLAHIKGSFGHLTWSTSALLHSRWMRVQINPHHGPRLRNCVKTAIQWPEGQEQSLRDTVAPLCMPNIWEGERWLLSSVPTWATD